MSELTYERPVIVKNPVGLMNKHGRRAELNTAAEIDGVPIDALCAEFGSPLFVFSERKLRAKIREARDAFAGVGLSGRSPAAAQQPVGLSGRSPAAAQQPVTPSVQLCWSYKTNYLGALCSIFHQEGSLAEVVSGMEYEKARRLGVPGHRIVFNGPAKSESELERAVREGAILHADHFEELELLERVAERLRVRARVGIRVSLDAGIHPRWDRFGFELEGGQAREAAHRIVQSVHLELGGLHSHIGTFVLDPAAYGRSAAKLANFAQEITTRYGVCPTHLDLGGGFASNNTLGAQYHSGALAPSLAEYAEEIARGLASSEANGLGIPILIETGRALIDDAGTLLASVIANKRLSNGKRAIVIDAGVNLLFTAWWYRLNIGTSRPSSAFLEDTIVYGPLCMNIDCVRESVPLPDLRAGEHLTIHPAGAYTFTQSMQFIKLRPACVLIDQQGKPELIRRAEQLDDLIAPELVPERLRSTASSVSG